MVPTQPIVAEVASVVGKVEKNVLTLDVPVNDATLVQVLESAKYLVRHMQYLFISERVA